MTKVHPLFEVSIAICHCLYSGWSCFVTALYPFFHLLWVAPSIFTKIVRDRPFFNEFPNVFFPHARPATETTPQVPVTRGCQTLCFHRDSEPWEIQWWKLIENSKVRGMCVNSSQDEKIESNVTTAIYQLKFKKWPTNDEDSTSLSSDHPAELYLFARKKHDRIMKVKQIFNKTLNDQAENSNISQSNCAQYESLPEHYYISLSTTAFGSFFKTLTRAVLQYAGSCRKFQDASVLHHYQWFKLPKRHFEIRDLTIAILQGLH